MQRYRIKANTESAVLCVTENFNFTITLIQPYWVFLQLFPKATFLTSHFLSINLVLLCLGGGII